MTSDQGHGPPLGLLLRLAHSRARKTFADALGSLGIHGAHYGVLLTLDRLGPMSQRQLIDAIDSDKSSMVRIVDDLEARGLVVRRPATGDRRAYAVELTEAGRTAFQAAEEIAAATTERLLAGFTSAERATLTELLQRLVARDQDSDR